MRHHLAEALIHIERAMAGLRSSHKAFREATEANARAIAQLVSHAPGHTIDGLLRRHVSDLRRAFEDEMSVVGNHLLAERKRLRAFIWIAPAPPAGSGGGHLRAYTRDGEPQVPDGVRYVPRPLIMPEQFGITFARQGPRLGVCYLAATLNAFGHAAPHFLSHIAREEDGAVLVTVPGGTYRLEATLPVWEDTGEPYSISSPDGSTLAAYIEKAAAAHLGSYSDLFAGQVGAPMRWIAGLWDGAVVRTEDLEEVDDARLTAIAEAGWPFVVGIDRQSDDNAFGEMVVDHFDLVEGHAYTGESIENLAVTTQNPWGYLHPTRAIAMAELRQVNGTICTLDLSNVSAPPAGPGTDTDRPPAGEAS